ncbi:MAG: 2OG-Fe(II) oxygenase [Acidimicrobiales bacterium]
MSSNPNNDLSALLRTLRSGGTFATRLTAPIHDLAIEVSGVGDLGLPVTSAQAKQLRLVARPAKYGHGERTILDRRVRDTWEVPRSRVRLDKRRWNRTLRPMLDAIRDDLGLPSESSLNAQLHSMLLYEPGQFFAAHQDSEKDDQMIASLVVLLPSRSAGGDLVVDHRGESVRYKGSSSSLTFVAFYADTRHEVLPVETGHRVVLTYDLVLTGDTTTPLAGAESIAPTTAGLLERHFAHTPEPRWKGGRQALDPPDRLVVLLDHQYTERGLRWSHLKGSDAARAQVLRDAAALAGCEVALAQAEIHETRDCYEDEPPRWGRRGWSDWDDDEADDGDQRGLTVGEILDSTVEIVPAVAEALRFDGAVSYAELAEVTPTAELVPYGSEYTGYMGNWGNTMDRWYRRAAIVIWPLARAFAIRAKGDPLGALDELLARTATDTSSWSARADDAAALLRFWPDAVRRGNQHELLPGALKLAWELGDEELATRLVEPFAIEAFSPTDASMLVALAEHYGFEWFDHRLSAWLEQHRTLMVGAAPTPTRTVSVERLPELCAALRDADQDPRGLGPNIERSLLRHLGAWLIEAVRKSDRITAPSRRELALAELAGPTIAVLRASGVAGDPPLRDRIVDALCDPGLRTTLMLVEVVKASTGMPTDERETVGAGTIAQHCRRALEAALKQPPRASDDWSITEFDAGTCCDDCTTLATFLTDPAAQQTTWPLAKPRRQHIHHRIDDAELPVTHRTTREGSPHKLVLTKTIALHQRDDERRLTNAASLDIVQQFLATM